MLAPAVLSPAQCSGRSQEWVCWQEQPGKAGTDLRRALASSPARVGAGQRGKGPTPAPRHSQAGGHIIPVGCQHTGLGWRFCRPSRGCGLLGKGAHTPTFPGTAPGPSRCHPRLGTHRDTSKEADGAQHLPGAVTLPASSPGSKRRARAPLHRHQACSPPACGTVEPGRATEPELGPCSHGGGQVCLEGSPGVAGRWPDACVLQLDGRLGPLPGRLGPPAAALGSRAGVPPLGRAGRETARQAASTPNFNETNKLIS